MKKINVLVLSTTASVIDQFNRNNIQILRNLNYNITVMANFKIGNTTTLEKNQEFYDELVSQDITVIDATIPRKLNPKLLFKSYLIIKKLVSSKHFALIHCHTPIASALLRLIYFLNTNSRVGKIIYTAHGFHFYKGAPILNWLLYYPVEKFFSACTDCLITINTEDYRLAKIKFKNIKSLHLINSVGLNLKKFFPVPLEGKLAYRRELGFSSRDYIIISVAEFNKNKNQELIVEAVKSLSKKRKNVLVLLVGIGPNLKKIKSIVTKYSLDNCISFFGYRNDVEKLLKISDLYLACSKREGLGLSVIEAMATGLPVVATNNRGHRDLIKNNQNGFLIPDNNPSLLCRKIEEIIESKDISNKFSRNNNKTIHKFSDTNIDRQMIDIFSDLNQYTLIQT